ncbi:hypothetical protein TIFTF001_006335 [Ficus carica]|uniref:Uncharacterized protein n=1 Tax=Ficus carica TaxID=3494 RepID=A0AA88D0M8_FICCA|nr:hypothetical protein TIFTF001_006335 [Ficus carica]
MFTVNVLGSTLGVDFSGRWSQLNLTEVMSMDWRSMPVDLGVELPYQLMKSFRLFSS